MVIIWHWAANHREQSEGIALTAWTFSNITKSGIAVPANSEIIVEYLLDHPELSPVEVSSYHQAFEASRDRLRFDHQMSSEEYKQAVVIPVWKKKQQDKPQPSEIDLILKELFESRGFRDSLTNRAPCHRYPQEHAIDDCSLENLSHLIDTVIKYPGLELSDQAIDALPSREFRKYVEQEFKRRQAKQPPKSSDKPPASIGRTG